MSDAVPIWVHVDECRSIRYIKPPKGDVRGNIACTPLDSTCTTLTGGKIPLGCCSETPIREYPNYLSCPICYLYYTSTSL